MDVRQLRMFVAVAEELHFGRAAARLHMAQPPLSQAIKRLEHELGVELFERTTRRVKLTPAGLVLLERSSCVFDALNAAVEGVQRAHQGRLGTLRVGFTTLAPHQMLPRLADHHHRKHPDVQLRPGNVPSKMQIDMLNSGRLDLGLLWLPAESSAVDLRGITCVKVVRQAMVAAVPVNHRLAATDRVSVADLRSDPFVSYIEPQGGSALREAMRYACQAAGYFPDIVQEAPDASALLAIVSTGVGVCLLPEAAREMAVPGTRILEISPPVPFVDYALVWRAFDRSSLVRGVVESVCELEGLPLPA